jgi:hypothetical protein
MEETVLTPVLVIITGEEAGAIMYGLGGIVIVITTIITIPVAQLTKLSMLKLLKKQASLQFRW